MVGAMGGATAGPCADSCVPTTTAQVPFMYVYKVNMGPVWVRRSFFMRSGEDQRVSRPFRRELALSRVAPI